MDLFLAGCQGLGLAIAAGAFGGASGRRDAAGTALLLVAVVAGGLLFGASLEEEDHPAWPGWALGALAAWFAFVVVADLARGAAARADAGAGPGLMIALAALVLAGLSLAGPLSPVSLAALGGLLWLAAGRRSRAARKHEGLRTLR
jgi:hypothetical protein